MLFRKGFMMNVKTRQQYRQIATGITGGLIACAFLFLAVSSSQGDALPKPSFSVGAGDVVEASVKTDTTGKAALVLILTSDKTKELNNITRENLGKRVALIVDGKSWGDPRVNEVISSSSMTLSAASLERASEAAKALMAGKK